tara:strand:+ start:948 stop:1112 length:165 start_codon:yes stop_codon:yes gene_type:complete
MGFKGSRRSTRSAAKGKLLPKAGHGGQKSLLTKLSMPSRPAKKAGGCGCGGQTR